MAKRDYKKEYKDHQSSEKSKRDRTKRNRDRRRENAKRKKKGLPPLKSNQHVAHKTKNGKTTTTVKSAKKNLGSKTDTPGDKRARGKGQKKRQPKRG